MAEYINKEDALGHLPQFPLSYNDDMAVAFLRGYHQAEDHMFDCLTANVEKVVYCKDCEFLTPSVWERGKGHCCRFGILRPFDWFCADGRNEDEEGESDAHNK